MTEETAGMILDNGSLFRYSGLVDSLRDAAEVLSKDAKNPVPKSTSSQMAQSFNTLRTKVSTVLRKDMAAELDELTAALDPDTADVTSVFVNAVQLSRFCDVVHQSPRFMLAERANAVSMAQIDKKIEKEDIPGVQSLLNGEDLEEEEALGVKVGMYL